MNPTPLRNTALALALAGLGCQGDGGGGGGEGSEGPAPAASSTTSDEPTTAGASEGDSSSAPTTSDATTTTSETSEAETAETTGAPTCVPFTPWFYDGFEGYAPGTKLTGGAPFSAAERTVATDAAAFAGEGAAQMEILPEDAGGFGRWGGIIPLPDVGAGRSVWVRLWVRWPASFEFSASPWMKFLRLHNRTADDENGGYNDLYVDNADGETSVLRVIKEVHDVWEVYDGPPLPRDTWERYEVQLVVDHVPVDEGGAARFRVWRDDALIFDRTDVPTITGPGGVIDGLYIFTYWNNEAPPHNVAFIDELAIAFDDTPPPEVDADGNPRIGGWLPCSDP
jgi:hypothetical protein